LIQGNTVRSPWNLGLGIRGWGLGDERRCPESEALISIARNEKDPALRKAAVEKLSMMQSKDATDYMLEILNK
jgi:hypothetical protein